MSEGPAKLSRGPSNLLKGTGDITEIQSALISYFKRHGFDILNPTINQLLTNIRKKTMREETYTSGKDVDGYLEDLESIKDSIVNAHPNCDLVKELDELIFELIFSDTEHTAINTLQRKIASLKKQNLNRPTPKLNMNILDTKRHIRKLSSIEKQIKELELFISLMLIITIIYDKSVLHLLIAGPLFSYQKGETESHKVRDGIGKSSWFRCNEALLNLESTLEAVDALYQWREIIESGNGISDEKMDNIFSEINKSIVKEQIPEEKIKKIIHLCTSNSNFAGFSDTLDLEGGSIKQKRRTQRKKTKRKKTKRKKTKRKKTNRKKQKKSKKSVQRGGNLLADGVEFITFIIVCLVLGFRAGLKLLWRSFVDLVKLFAGAIGSLIRKNKSRNGLQGYDDKLIINIEGR